MREKGRHGPSVVLNVPRAEPGGGVWALALTDPEIPFYPQK